MDFFPSLPKLRHKWFTAGKPCLSKPDGGHHPYVSTFLTPIMYGSAADKILNILLGIFYKNIKISIIIEHTSVYQFILKIFFAPLSIFYPQLFIRKLGLGIFIEHFHIAMGRCRIQVIIDLLYILPMISFRSGQAKHPLLDHWILSIPKSPGNT